MSRIPHHLAVADDHWYDRRYSSRCFFTNPPAETNLAMPAEYVATVVCPSCGADLPAAADRCPHCRQSTTDSAPSPDELAAKGQGARAMLDNPWIILGMLFFVTAALGLPFLWASRAFSRPAKVALTVVVTLYTVLILWLFWLVVSWSWTRIVESL